MFVLRSAFWLVIGFLLVAPHGTDFGARAATALEAQAVEAGVAVGRQLVVSQLTGRSALPDLFLSAAPAPSPAGAVLPRPRPAALG